MYVKQHISFGIIKWYNLIIVSLFKMNQHIYSY